MASGRWPVEESRSTATQIHGSSIRGDVCFQPGGEFGGFEAPGAAGGGVGDAAGGVDGVEALGPGGVEVVDAVVEGVDDAGDGEVEGVAAGGGDGAAVAVGGGAIVDDAVGAVDGELPAVVGVGLVDVDEEEGDAVAVFVVKALEGARLAPEGRSGEAAEDQDGGSAGGELRERDGVGAVALRKREVGRRGADGRRWADHAGARTVPIWEAAVGRRGVHLGDEGVGGVGWRGAAGGEKRGE